MFLQHQGFFMTALKFLCSGLRSHQKTNKRDPPRRPSQGAASAGL
jgi:hypothetical protein